MLYQKHII